MGLMTRKVRLAVAFGVLLTLVLVLAPLKGVTTQCPGRPASSCRTFYETVFGFRYEEPSPMALTLLIATTLLTALGIFLRNRRW